MTSPEVGWGKLFEPGERIENRFRIDRRIIIGTAGVTYLCQETDDEELVLRRAVGEDAVIGVEY